MGRGHNLATSREGLGVTGERIFAVASLDVPNERQDADAIAQCDAVRLFVSRAQAASLKKPITATTKPWIAVENSPAISDAARHNAWPSNTTMASSSDGSSR